MVSTPVAVGTVFSACHINVVSLEWITSTPEGKQFGYALTFFQFLFVGLCTLPFMIKIGKARRQSDDTYRWVCCMRPLSIPKKQLILISFVFWFLSTMNNLVFAYNVSVPVHTVFRSLSLVFSILIGYFLFHQRFTWQQVVCALVITVGLMVLTLEGRDKRHHRVLYNEPEEAIKEAVKGVKDTITEQASKARASVTGDKAATTTEDIAATVGQFFTPEYVTWLQGMALLVITSFLSPFMGHFQDKIIRTAKSNQVAPDEDTYVIAPPPVSLEMLCFSHLFASPFFLLNFSHLYMTSSALTSDLYTSVAVNLLSQLMCIRGVYILFDVGGSFVMTLTTTLRKFVSLVFSTFWFGHYQYLSVAECVCFFTVGLAGSIYPFLPKAKPQAAAAATTTSGAPKRVLDFTKNPPKAFKTTGATAAKRASTPRTGRRSASASKQK